MIRKNANKNKGKNGRKVFGWRQYLILVIIIRIFYYFPGLKCSVILYHMFNSHEFFPILSPYSDHYPANPSHLSSPNYLLPYQQYPIYLTSPIQSIKPITFYSPSPFLHPNFSHSAKPHNLTSPEGKQTNKSEFISYVMDMEQSPSFQKKDNSEDEANMRKNSREHKNNLKGLRSLSQSVYQIALQLKVTTYKQVASRLVSLLYDKESQNQFLPKDQQNIKRRVYDALNVLISAEILQKNGKEVICNDGRIPEKMRKHESGENSQMIQKIDKEIQDRLLRIEQKRRNLEELERKQRTMMEILKRNKKKKFINGKKVSFPLVAIAYEDFGTTKMKQKKEEVKIDLDCLLEMRGDIDVLVNVDLASHSIDEIIDSLGESNQNDIQQ